MEWGGVEWASHINRHSLYNLFAAVLLQERTNFEVYNACTKKKIGVFTLSPLKNLS